MDVEEITLAKVDWCNNHRLHLVFGNIPPEEYGQKYAENKGRSNSGAANKTAAWKSTV